MTALVFGEFDQVALDREYDTRGQVPTVGLYRARWEEESEAVRRRPGSMADVTYGNSPMERLDIFPPARRAAPVSACTAACAAEPIDVTASPA